MTETTETTTRKGRKANPLTAIVNEVKDKADDNLDIPFLGGRNSEQGQAYHAEQELRWISINRHRGDIGKLGADGLLVEDAHAAGAATTTEERREALILLAAQAVAAVAQLDRGEG
ncbi:hypothetical protein SEA_DEXERS_40 [Streptomyces phage Dexers]|uniref:Uncharacterized protein n=1 Tax=Streptomyces phage Alsaber TaxID=2053672 RepID=A0A2H4PGG2_9CAUD|nr:hypothetical protein KGG97_gp42 [Streptomyces phage Alsaber]ATW61316.1 hypothetical protein SEA_ALSABER_42 [Streptomyces phage Alsaber]WMI34560.1 hypothetical protein SEA_DEXERS_40 [Streptomyces phage Dexers]